MKDASATQPNTAHLPRRALRAYALGAVGLVVLATSFVVRAQWPALTPEERGHIGTWYGYINEGDLHYCWVTQFRRDLTCRTSFRSFPSTEFLVNGPLNPASDPVIERDESVGTWRMQGAEYETQTWYPAREPGTWDRLLTLASENRWPAREVKTNGYRVVRISANRLDYTLSSSRQGLYHAVRVGDDFVLPEAPLTPDEAIARTATKVGDARSP